MYFNDYNSHQARWDKLDKETDEPDEWVIHDEHVLVLINDLDMMENAKRMIKVNLRQMFDRIDTPEKPLFQNFLEVTPYFEGDRLYTILDIDEEFLKKIGQYGVIRFGKPEDFIELPVNRDEDFANIQKDWLFVHDDDEWFKNKN